ncbi:M48 family metalloprotease [Taibaiella koreensis]|uniref:hypothetical protein n=1 Tax=Taibaiella koreensis TaxID=1268548 RepID=UPI0013C3395C|nr:hypothetical protein [Taibaiella koreensis]
MLDKLSCEEALADLRRVFKVMMPDEDSIALTRELWQEWEKSGERPPDISEIAKEHAIHENGFFYELVKVAERMDGSALNIHFCQVSLEEYSACALSATDGYIVLVDDVFFQLLYILSNIMVFDAMGVIDKGERETVKTFVQEIIDTNYFQRQRFDFTVDNIHNTILKRDYELAELANYLFHAFKAFILAHEIGHHVLKHTTGGVKKILSANGHTDTVEVDSRSIAREFEADSYGYRLFSALCNTVDDSVYYAYCKYKLMFAPLLLFQLFDRLDRMQERRTQEPVGYTQHPHPLERAEALSAVYPVDAGDPLCVAIRDAMVFYMS